MPTEDLRFYDGTSWQSLSELAAEQVGVALPISSTDDTVTLDSPSANTFTIITGGSERVTVDSAGNVGIGVAPVSTVGVYYQHTISGSSIASFLADNVIESAAETASYFRSRASISAGVTVDNLRHFSADAKNVKGTATEQVAYFCDDLGNGAYSFYADKNPAYIKDILSSRIIGSAAPDTDASLELNQHAKIIAGTSYYQLLNNGFHLFQCDGSQSRFTNDGRFLINTQTPDAGYISTFRQNKAGETGVVRFVTDNTDGTANLYIDCNPTTGIVSLKSSSQVCLVQADGGTYTPTQPNSIATKQTVDDKIQVMTTAEYNAIATKNPTTLYCLTD